MEKILKKGFGGLFWALLLAAVLTVAADILAAVFWQPLPRLPSLLGVLALFALLALLPVGKRALRWDFFAVLLLLLLAALVCRGALVWFERGRGYKAEDAGKRALYGKQRVLVAVPRQGDELRLAGGVLEAVLRYDGELAFVYTEGGRETAIAEALGVPEANVYEGEALAGALAEFRPTLILALKEEQAAIKTALNEAQLSPTVLYGLLWSGEAAFYTENLRSLADPGRYVRAGLSWESRVRLPVEPGALSHSLLGCREYQLLSLLGAEGEAEQLIRGDRVFWALDAVKPSFDFVKLTNEDGDFVYDYYITQTGRARFPLYTSGKADQPYSVSVIGEKCSARISQGRVMELSCPKGRSCVVTVTSADGKYSDTVRVSNPGRFFRETAQGVERFLRGVREEAVPSTNLVAFWQLLKGFVE